MRKNLLFCLSGFLVSLLIVVGISLQSSVAETNVTNQDMDDTPPTLVKPAPVFLRETVEIQEDLNNGESTSISRRLYLKNLTNIFDDNGRDLYTVWEKDTDQAPQEIYIPVDGEDTRKSKMVDVDVPARFDIKVWRQKGDHRRYIDKFRWEVPHYTQSETIWIGKRYTEDAVELLVCKGAPSEPECYLSLGFIPRKDW